MNFMDKNAADADLLLTYRFVEEAGARWNFLSTPTGMRITSRSECEAPTDSLVLHAMWQCQQGGSPEYVCSKFGTQTNLTCESLLMLSNLGKPAGGLDRTTCQ